MDVNGEIIEFSTYESGKYVAVRLFSQRLIATYPPNGLGRNKRRVHSGGDRTGSERSYLELAAALFSNLVLPMLSSRKMLPALSRKRDNLFRQPHRKRIQIMVGG